MTTETLNLETAAHLASSLAVPSSLLLRAVELADARPRMTVNGRRYFDAEAVNRIAIAAKRLQQEQEPLKEKRISPC